MQKESPLGTATESAHPGESSFFIDHFVFFFNKFDSFIETKNVCVLLQPDSLLMINIQRREFC